MGQDSFEWRDAERTRDGPPEMRLYTETPSGVLFGLRGKIAPPRSRSSSRCLIPRTNVSLRKVEILQGPALS
ncbi:hypothetical protein RRG08_046547 [Elysia crispata]|uniref:Uncharacterized protein n=1 Tax=Elysia crispata TaxID=231223 RepID=A0AAE1DC76_9GAST|nr:hypothetical protein RRG08_046547 [Elysia crispata]